MDFSTIYNLAGTSGYRLSTLLNSVSAYHVGPLMVQTIGMSNDDEPNHVDYRLALFYFVINRLLIILYWYQPWPHLAIRL